MNQRSSFHIPHDAYGNELVYLCGNSLGLMPRSVSTYIDGELDDWKNLGVEGHMHARRPWLPYHERLSASMARIVGAHEDEVVVMNSLTVNLHLMMVSFYRPTTDRYKILIDYNPFPSDRYALSSQLQYHGYDPTEGIIELTPDPGTSIVSDETIQQVLAHHGHEIALIMIGGVNYYSGQVYNLPLITQLGHAMGCKVGFDLAHAAGNVDIQLSSFNPDFAVWCSYKYLNSGPGSLSGCYVNRRHHGTDLPRFEGWWGHDKSTRFKMGPDFIPIPTVEAWQLSNPPILSMAAIRASLDIFDRTNISDLHQESLRLTDRIITAIVGLDHPNIEIVTPLDAAQRGSQISIRMKNPDKSVFDQMITKGIIGDWREPDVIRIATCPLYNHEGDVDRFIQLFTSIMKSS
jgi:kynureninase